MGRRRRYPGRRRRGRGVSQQRATGTGGGTGDEDDRGAAGAVEHDEVKDDACADAIGEESLTSSS
jgi:hypothetical protein